MRCNQKDASDQPQESGLTADIFKEESRLRKAFNSLREESREVGLILGGIAISPFEFFKGVRMIYEGVRSDGPKDSYRSVNYVISAGLPIAVIGDIGIVLHYTDPKLFKYALGTMAVSNALSLAYESFRYVGNRISERKSKKDKSERWVL